MEIKFKKLDPRAVTPAKAHITDAGWDLTCTRIDTTVNECGQLMLVYHTDLAIELPEGYVALLFPRSSIYKKSLRQTNSVGVIDAGYRGEVMAVMHTTTDVIPAVYKEGERFCQLVIMKLPEASFVEVDELNDTDRSEGGFGSTGTDNETSAPNTPDGSSEDETAVTNQQEAQLEAAGDAKAPEQV